MGLLRFKSFVLTEGARGVFHKDKIGNGGVIYKKLFYIMTATNTDGIKDFTEFENHLSTKPRGAIVVFSASAIAARKATKKEWFPKYYSTFSAKTNRGIKYLYLYGTSKTTLPDKFVGVTTPNVTKGKVATIPVKPLNFKSILDKWHTVESLQVALFKDIDRNKKMPPEFKLYLKSLYNYYMGDGAIEHADHESVQTNSGGILKDFGEIIGPVWYLRKNNAPKGKIFYPRAGNFPLLDSIIKVRKGEVKVSSKSGKGVANTLKGGDLFKVIEELTPEGQAWLEHDFKRELKILKVIDDGNMAQGLIDFLRLHDQKNIASGHKKSLDLIYNTSLVKQETTVLGKVGEEDLLESLIAIVGFSPKAGQGANIDKMSGAIFLLGKLMEEASKRMKFKELTEEVLNGRLIFIKAYPFNKKTGAIFFTSTIEGDLKIPVAFLRWKGSSNAPSDKMGIELKL